jgi:hypothetical protein
MFQQFQTFFKRVALGLEQNTLPLHRYLLLFMAILSIRLCLEFFANQRLFRLEDALHISLWFAFIVLAFMLQLHLFSKEKVENIMKLVICCFSIALTAPLIDLIVSQGKLSKMNYLSIQSSSDFLKSYLTIGGASLSRGATLGIRIEIVLLIFASFNYVYIKTASILRALIGTFSIYTVLFLSGAIPYFLSMLNASIGISYGTNDQSSIYLLFTLDVLLILTLLFRHAKNNKILQFHFTTFLRLLVGIFPIVLGVYFARTAYPNNWQLDPTTIYYFPLLLLLITVLFAYENLVKHHENSSFLQRNTYFVFIVLIASCISFSTFFAGMIIWSCSFLLYEAPLYLNKILILKWLLTSFQLLGYLLLGFMTFGAPMIGINSILVFSLLGVSLTFCIARHYIMMYIYRAKRQV